MKKYVSIIALMLVMVMVLSGCGSTAGAKYLSIGTGSVTGV